MIQPTNTPKPLDLKCKAAFDFLFPATTNQDNEVVEDIEKWEQEQEVIRLTKRGNND